jgi:hypothetical protein
MVELISLRVMPAPPDLHIKNTLCVPPIASSLAKGNARDEEHEAKQQGDNVSEASE